MVWSQCTLSLQTSSCAHEKWVIFPPGYRQVEQHSDPPFMREKPCFYALHNFHSPKHLEIIRISLTNKPAMKVKLDRIFWHFGKNSNLRHTVVANSLSLELPPKRPSLAAVLLDSYKSLQVVTSEKRSLQCTITSPITPHGG